ncbi:MAG: NAD-dependent epimerase/dehydratase family protein, partial [Candidatus Dormibacteria bacterium]
ALAGKDITIYGTGNQTRSFCYIDDLIQGFMALGASDLATPTNIGNPTEFTINDLARVIVSLTDSKSHIIRLPLPQDDPQQRKPDITKLSASTGWKPTVSLMTGIEQTIKYFQGN